MNYRIQKHARGAALVELAVVVTALLGSLLLLTSLLGKQIDAKHDYEQALRYAAWERTVWLTGRNAAVPSAPVKSNAEIGNEIQARIYADRAVLLRSDQRAGTRQEAIDSMLSMPIAIRLDTRNDATRPWLVNRVTNNARPQYAGRVEQNTAVGGVAAQGVNAMIRGLESLTSFNVQNNGLYRTQLETDLADTRYYTQLLTNVNSGRPIDLRVDRERDGSTRNLTLLADGWNVGGPNHARDQAASMVATEFLDNAAIDTVMSVIGWFPMAREIGWLEFGKVDPEQVPAQRLGRYR
jgi:hypothetical protein